MGKPKSNASSSATPSPENDSQLPESQTVRIIFQGQCPKLTPRGTGELTYEIGIETDTDTPLLRIAGNTSSGAFNHDWVEVDEIRSIMEKKSASGSTFSAIIFQDLFSGQSSNNHGYLAAIL